MTEAVRTHLEVIAPDVTVTAYSDGDVVIHVSDDESTATSLGENYFDEEGCIEWNGSTVYLFDAYPSYGLALTEKEALELEQTLYELGY